MKLLFITLIALLPLNALAGNYAVFGIKSELSMSDEQKVRRDIYVNMGTEQGIKVGSVLDVFRVLTTVDEIQQKVGKNFSFKFARLKVIHAEKDMAVARIHDYLPAESTPVGLYTNVMVGDQVEIGKK